MDSPFDRHVFVCSSGKVCPRQGAGAVVDTLRTRLKAAAKEDPRLETVRISKSGCFAQCGYGPMVVVYPEDVWYAAVRPEDAEEIFERHVLRGEVVERLIHRPPGVGKQICPKGEEPVRPEDPPP